MSAAARDECKWSEEGVSRRKWRVCELITVLVAGLNDRVFIDASAMAQTLQCVWDNE